MITEKREFKLVIDATLEAEDVIDALQRVATHFQARADHLAYGEEKPLPQTFGYGSQVRLIPIQRVVIEEVTEGDDALAGDNPAA